MRLLRGLLSLVFCLAALTVHAAHTQATLVLSDDTAKPGDTVWAGVDLKMDPDWHTYWKNSGEAGMPTAISWHLPTGITAGDIQWPLPYKFPPIEVTTYGYTNETMLLVPLKIGAHVPPGQLTLNAEVTWLECKEVCIPVQTSVQTTLNIGSETETSANAARIDSWKTKVPQANGFGFSSEAWWNGPASNDTRSLTIVWWLGVPAASAAPLADVDFYPDASDNYEIQPATKVLSACTVNVRVQKAVKNFSGDWPNDISGVIVTTGNNGSRNGFALSMPIEDHAPSVHDPFRDGAISASAQTNAVAALGPASTNKAVTTSPAQSLALKLLEAFVGGLILNVMPCVLPVIALKILGFVSEARSEPRRVRNLGFIYALGVSASFSVLAAVFIGLKAGGRHIGWGMQFGSPVFVVCLTTLVMLVALNLFGIFEITPGGRVMNAAGELASKHGAPGAFFNGFLATALATPCTAAFLAGALGFAFTQSAAIIFLILLFVGIGLAAPYVLLSCNPSLLKFLPKPGPWMEKFKMAMGFPMLMTVVWLFNVASSDYGSRVLWLGIFLVIVAFAAWIFGEFVQRGSHGRGIGLAVTVLLLIGGYAYALDDHLHWREMAAENTAGNSLIDTSANGVAWKPWTPEAVTQARADGKPVLVDFTATWCVTCNAIVKPALETKAVVDAIQELDATALLGDYTRTPQQMTDEISKYGGAGVPLVLVFPKNPEAPAIVVPQPDPLELPSSYSRKVLNALEQAGQ